VNARALFLAPSGLVRAPWKIFVFAVVSVLAFIATSVTIGPILSSVFSRLGVANEANESWLVTIALLIATAICVRLMDKAPWRAVWLDSSAAQPRLLAGGFVLGALAIGLPIVALIGTGWLREAAAARGSWWVACLRVSVLLLPAALAEELLLRGYILSVLRDSWGWAWAISATSIGFGLLHLKNPGATAESLTLVTLAGFFLALVLYASRSLYAAWMAHFAWNWTMAVVFHASVSGLAMEAPSYRYVDAGPDWATGGQWGPEGGAPAAIGLAAGIALLISRRRRSGAGPSDGAERS
jgi:membrane protease YdiL (CAAX protease family)